MAGLAWAEVGLDSLPGYRATVLRQAEIYTGATGSTELDPHGTIAPWGTATSIRSAAARILRTELYRISDVITRSVRSYTQYAECGIDGEL